MDKENVKGFIMKYGFYVLSMVCAMQAYGAEQSSDASSGLIISHIQRAINGATYQEIAVIAKTAGERVAQLNHSRTQEGGSIEVEDRKWIGLLELFRRTSSENTRLKNEISAAWQKTESEELRMLQAKIQKVEAKKLQEKEKLEKEKNELAQKNVLLTAEITSLQQQVTLLQQENISPVQITPKNSPHASPNRKSLQQQSSPLARRRTVAGRSFPEQSVLMVPSLEGLPTPDIESKRMRRAPHDASLDNQKHFF